jgi:hypothetical protein
LKEKHFSVAYSYQIVSIMALNGPGVFHRTREHEEEDSSNVTKNFLAESWKSWPNEAAVSPFDITYHFSN